MPAPAHRPLMSSGWLAAQGRLPLAFMVLALGWLVIATGLLASNPQVLAWPHSRPHVVALAHAWVLGFFVTVACGAVYQLAPVALGTTLASERYGWWHFGLHAVGVPGMVYSFWFWDLKALGHFGFAVALGVLIFAINTWRTVRSSGRTGLVARSLSLAAGWLLATVLVGLLLAANRYWYFIPVDPIILLRVHAHIGLVGFFITLLQGVSFQLVPMFTLGEVKSWRLPGVGLVLTQIGLITLVPAWIWQSGWVATSGAVAINAGLICSGLGLWRVLITRRKHALDPGLLWFLRGGVGICAAGLGGLVLVAPVTPWGSSPGGFGAMPYAILAIGVGLLPCISGMMCKVVPFLTWMRAYGPRVGRGATPAAGGLTHPRIEQWGLGLQFAAIVPLLVGAWRLSTTWLETGTWILAGGVGLFAIDMIGVLRHLRPVPTDRTGKRLATTL